MNEIKPGKMFECYISNVTDPSDFHIQLKSTEPLIRQIMYEMAQFYDNPENLEKYKIRGIEPGKYLPILKIEIILLNRFLNQFEKRLSFITENVL